MWFFHENFLIKARIIEKAIVIVVLKMSQKTLKHSIFVVKRRE